MQKRSLLALGVAATFAPISAKAQPVRVALRQGGNIPDRPFLSQMDVLGIRAGMTIDDVRRAASAEFSSEPTIRRSNLALQVGAVSVQTEPFVSQMVYTDAERAHDLTVWFSPPTLGSVVVGVQRTLAFLRNVAAAPVLVEIRRQVETKYGTPTNIPRMPSSDKFWVFGPRGRIAQWQCPGITCEFLPSFNFNNSTQVRVRTYMDAGAHYALTARLNPAPGDQSRLGILELHIDDIWAKVSSTEIAMRQMQEAAQSANDRGPRERPNVRL